ncbi:hypothetical protein [Microbacterium soli]|uniref:DUF4386 family protein n=1 Tax=Microbacterium soli TaxID=446075 RepID=A0ABP7NDT1_9MICO
MSGRVSRAEATRAQERTPRDSRRFRRVTAAILMPVGPLILAFLRLHGDGSDTYDEIVADPSGQWAASLWNWLALFSLVGGAIAAVHLMMRRAPILATVTGAILTPAYIAMGALSIMDGIAWGAVRTGLDRASSDALSEAAFEGPITFVPVLIFVLGHITGVILLGILAMRTRFMPLWFGLLFTVSQIVHLVATFGGIPWLDFIGWGTTAIGMGVLGWHVLRTPDDIWEAAPIPRPRKRA